MQILLSIEAVVRLVDSVEVGDLLVYEVIEEWYICNEPKVLLAVLRSLQELLDRRQLTGAKCIKDGLQHSQLIHEITHVF